METLKTVVTGFVRENHGALPLTYKWKIPRVAPPYVDFVATRDSHFSDNIRLRERLAVEWRRFPEHRFELAKWYVSTWGGVKRNHDETLAAYVALESGKLCRSGIKGIATWSKILALSDPLKFTIFDARVAACLNALMLKNDIDLPLFPILLSQNHRIVAFNRLLKSRKRAGTVFLEQSAYDTWIDVAGSVAGRLNLDLEIVEMTLFAKAIDAIAEFMPVQRS